LWSPRCLVGFYSLPIPIYQVGKHCPCQKSLMTYKTKLFPWCITRPLPNMGQTIVARFRRRCDAEARLRILQQLIPSPPYTIMFDVMPDALEEDVEVAKPWPLTHD
jgi:hypothetical protein